MRISEILSKKGGLVISFEFFPPRKEENWPLFWDTVNRLKRWNPDFISITYGAGGSTHGKSIELSITLRKMGFNVMTHLTCISTPIKKIEETLNILKDEDIENILALRGDIPDGWKRDDENSYFSYAWQLVEFASQYNFFCIGVAGYPEGHIESKSLEEDIRYLKFKVEKGAHFVITQLFFDNAFFYDFVERATKVGINVPIIPGIMPITSFTQIVRFTSLCGATIPQKLMDLLKRYKEDPEAVKKIGIEHAINQCRDLIRNGVRALHFYTLNTSPSVEFILEELSVH
ncbi:MAG: methylenetetrahydrofolate reductase [NAD(P)H] [Thermosulfidibacteraceae bacterium]|jgi:methylenetetrahydrofolate reductase (NADPH)